MLKQLGQLFGVAAQAGGKRRRSTTATKRTATKRTASKRTAIKGGKKSAQKRSQKNRAPDAPPLPSAHPERVARRVHRRRARRPRRTRARRTGVPK